VILFGGIVNEESSEYDTFRSETELMGLAQSEEELADRASRFLKAELKRAGVTYAALAERLKEHGLRDETEASIKAKLARGTFAATFFLACLAALELGEVPLEDI
jgi:2-hydroxychromene-2-carboxylate isomerase